MSGIQPSDAALASFQSVKKGAKPFAVFEIQDEKTVESTHESDLVVAKDDKFSKFQGDVWSAVNTYVEENLTDRAAYIIVDFAFSADGRDQAKLVLISWCPANKIKVKAKMLHGSTLNAIKQSFEGIQGKPIQADCLGELDYDAVLSEVKGV